MKKMQKRILAVILAVAMMSTLICTSNTAKAAVDYSSLATDLSLDGNWSGEYWMTDTDKEDYFRITIPSDGKFTFKIMSYISDLNWTLYTQDWAKTLSYGEADYGTETAPNTKEYSWGLSAGTYYISVDSYRTGRYKMYGAFTSWNTTDQGANSFDAPLDLGMGTQMTGAITVTDSEDWYRITVPSTGYYSVKVVAYGNVDYYLYNSDLSKRIADDTWIDGTESAPDTNTYDYTLSAGTYFIKMCNSSRQSRYVLSWYTLTPDICTHDYQNTYVSATYLSKGYTKHTCKKCGYSYKDSYTNKLTLNQGSIYYLLSGKKKLTVRYWGVSNADGIQIRYSKDKKFKKGVKTVKVKSGYSGSKTVKKLSSRKRYYVQVRGYKKVSGKTVYGKWSSKKSIKVK